LCATAQKKQKFRSMSAAKVKRIAERWWRRWDRSLNSTPAHRSPMATVARLREEIVLFKAGVASS
jgi:hypothetical protein